MRVAPEIILTNEERVELMKLVRSRLTSVRLEQRAGIVLLAADGFQNMDIAEMLGLGRPSSTVKNVSLPSSTVKNVSR